jgi:hypothetical protein
MYCILCTVQQDLKKQKVRMEKERINEWKIYVKTLQKQRTQKKYSILEQKFIYYTVESSGI